MLNQFLFKKIDIAQLVVFRVFYGLLVSAECGFGQRSVQTFCPHRLDSAFSIGIKLGTSSD
ncbi:MAG: hypothetical protein VX798_06915 [Bacteroidota bacterium]|nr:hypothetical protein [Bacteroidota bacterium]